MPSNFIVFLIDFIGTVAFALSGVSVAIKSKMDIFGVIILSVCTAVGGGIVRDLVLGITPPTAFVHPFSSEVAVVVALLMFFFVYITNKKGRKLDLDRLMDFFIFFDAIGLGSFTITGIVVAYTKGYDSTFLMLFTGMLTGVGGGALRDIFADTIPFIFSRHIYASASLLGGFIFIELIKYTNIKMSPAMIIGVTFITALRMLSVKRNWNLPRIEYEK